MIAREISGAEYGTEKKKRDKFFLEVYLVGTTLSQATHHHIPKWQQELWSLDCDRVVPSKLFLLEDPEVSEMQK